MSNYLKTDENLEETQFINGEDGFESSINNDRAISGEVLDKDYTFENDPELQSDVMIELKAELKADINELKVEMTKSQTALKAEMTKSQTELKEELKTTVNTAIITTLKELKREVGGGAKVGVGVDLKERAKVEAKVEAKVDAKVEAKVEAKVDALLQNGVMVLETEVKPKRSKPDNITFKLTEESINSASTNNLNTMDNNPISTRPNQAVFNKPSPHNFLKKLNFFY